MAPGTFAAELVIYPTGAGTVLWLFDPRRRWLSMGTLHDEKAAFAALITRWPGRVSWVMLVASASTWRTPNRQESSHAT
jgi:hypothetical protein